MAATAIICYAYPLTEDAHMNKMLECGCLGKRIHPTVNLTYLCVKQFNWQNINKFATEGLLLQKYFKAHRLWFFVLTCEYGKMHVLVYYVGNTNV